MTFDSPWHTAHWRQWQTADAYDVEVVVAEQRPAHGLTRLERRMVAAELTLRGIAAAEIARLLGVTPRSVHRWRDSDRRRAAR